MTKTEMIANQLNRKSWDIGMCLNYLQSLMAVELSSKAFNRYLKLATQDANMCDGMDGMLLNGEYFDWKEFDWNKESMIKAYLRYFNENEIELIYKYFK